MYKYIIYISLYKCHYFFICLQSPRDTNLEQNKNVDKYKINVRKYNDSEDSDSTETEIRGDGITIDSNVKNDISKQQKKYNELNKQIDNIDKTTEQLQQLLIADTKSSSEEKRKLVSKRMDQIISDGANYAALGKQLLEKLKEENDNFASIPENQNSARQQIRENLYYTNAVKFSDVLSKLTTAREDLRSNLTERVIRQTKIVDGGKRSDEEIRNLVENGQVENIIAQALHSDRIEDIVDELRDRNAEILKLQKSVQELYEMFKDLHTLIRVQGETLNIIENRIAGAKDYTEKGIQQLVKATEHSKKARKLKCCILIFQMAILIGVTIPIIIKYKHKF